LTVQYRKIVGQVSRWLPYWTSR